MLSGGDQNVSKTGLMKVDGFSDPDDYVDIESGQTDKLYSMIICIIYLTKPDPALLQCFSPTLLRLWSPALTGVHATFPHPHHSLCTSP